MEIGSLLQGVGVTYTGAFRAPSPSGTIGTTGTYQSVLQALITPLTQDYTTDGGAGLQAYGDLTATQQCALAWLRTDTAAAYANLRTSTRANVSRNGGEMHVKRVGAEFSTAPGGDGDLYVTGGCSAVASQAMNGSTLMTFADCNTVTVTGNANDVFSFGLSDSFTVVGDDNTIYGGPGASGFNISGHFNVFRGGEGCSTVTMQGSAAAANIVIGGVGSLKVNSTAPVTQFIGGPGCATLNLVGDYSSVLLGAGDTTGRIVGNGVNIETGSGCATLDVTTTGGGVIVTGSGSSRITVTGNGESVMEGDASGYAVFTLSGLGCTVCGGDYVTVNGTGMEVRSRAEGLTGTLSSRFTSVLGNMNGFAGDPVVASAIAAAEPVFSLAGTVNGGQGPGCYSAPRIINLNADQSAVYADTRYDLITIRGDSNNAYGSAAGRTVVIASGSGNAIWGAGGCNVYAGNGQSNVLEYIALPGTDTAPGPVKVDLGLGFAINASGGLDRISGINWVEAASGSLLVGGCSDARLTVIGNGGTLRDGAGNDTLYATGDRNTLQSSRGNDLLHTGGQDNTYLIGSGCLAPGATEIRQDFLGITGAMQFVTPTAPSQLWFNQSAAGDLVIHVLGSREVVTVDNWFGPQATQLRAITAGGFTIDTAGVNALTQTMQSYQNTHAGFDPNTAGRLPSDSGVGGAIAANWHAG